MMDLPTTFPVAARTRTAFVAAASFAVVTVAVLVAGGCRTAPVSGRKQLVLIPESQEIQLGIQAYEETLAGEPMSENADIVAMVERVGQRIAAVADKPEYDWEFRVIAKDVQNAFALPGGKVAIYEGILPVAQSEAGLAVVMSHEIAHAIARHGGERMSHQMAVSGAGKVFNAVVQRKADEATSQKIMQVYGASSKYGVILPFSRKHESEADAIGLILMAKAGYDPSVAPEFWERFSSGASGEKPPEWLSTHPADARRAADLRAMLPEAMKYYEAAQTQLGMGEPIPFPTADLGDPVPVLQKPDVQVASTASTLPYGSVSALTGKQTGKKQSATQTLHAEVAKPVADSAIQPAAAAIEVSTGDMHWAHGGVNNADFQLPVKSAADGINQDGWEASGEPNPFE